MPSRTEPKRNRDRRMEPQTPPQSRERSESAGRDRSADIRAAERGSTSGALEPINRLRQDFSRMLDQYFRGWPSPMSLWEAAGAGATWGLDVREDDDRMVVRAEAPGFEPSDFDIDVQGNQLILRAVRRDESSEEGRGYRQWRHQEFYRAVPLSSSVDADRIEAKYRNGILTVTIPKSAQARRRRIEVST